jgi:hypothetical protein
MALNTQKTWLEQLPAGDIDNNQQKKERRNPPASGLAGWWWLRPSSPPPMTGQLRQVRDKPSSWRGNALTWNAKRNRFNEVGKKLFFIFWVIWGIKAVPSPILGSLGPCRA